MYLTTPEPVEAETRGGIEVYQGHRAELNHILPSTPPSFLCHHSYVLQVQSVYAITFNCRAIKTALVGLFRRDYWFSLLLASVDVDTCGDHSQDHNVACDARSVSLDI